MIVTPKFVLTAEGRVGPPTAPSRACAISDVPRDGNQLALQVLGFAMLVAARVVYTQGG